MVKNLLKSALWRRFLKSLSDEAATIKSQRLFHASIIWEKRSQQNCLRTI